MARTKPIARKSTGGKAPRKTVDVKMNDRTMVVMMGTDFQKQFTHEVPKTKKQADPRISITFRYIATKTDSSIECMKPSVFVFDDIRHVDFQEVYDDVRQFFVPDVTRMFGKCYTNNGRMVADMVLPTHFPFSYKYAGKTVEGHIMTPVIMRLLEKLKNDGHGAYNWAHIVYYPNGNTKLCAHSDDEPEIQTGSPILGLSLFANKNDSRILRFRSKDPNVPLPQIHHIKTQRISVSS